MNDNHQPIADVLFGKNRDQKKEYIQRLNNGIYPYRCINFDYTRR